MKQEFDQFMETASTNDQNWFNALKIQNPKDGAVYNFADFYKERKFTKVDNFRCIHLIFDNSQNGHMSMKFIGDLELFIAHEFKDVKFLPIVKYYLS